MGVPPDVTLSCLHLVFLTVQKKIFNFIWLGVRSGGVWITNLWWSLIPTTVIYT